MTYQNSDAWLHSIFLYMFDYRVDPVVLKRSSMVWPTSLDKIDCVLLLRKTQAATQLELGKTKKLTKCRFFNPIH